MLCTTAYMGLLLQWGQLLYSKDFPHISNGLCFAAYCKPTNYRTVHWKQKTLIYYLFKDSKKCRDGSHTRHRFPTRFHMYANDGFTWLWHAWGGLSESETPSHLIRFIHLFHCDSSTQIQGHFFGPCKNRQYLRSDCKTCYNYTFLWDMTFNHFRITLAYISPHCLFF